VRIWTIAQLKKESIYKMTKTIERYTI